MAAWWLKHIVGECYQFKDEIKNYEIILRYFRRLTTRSEQVSEAANVNKTDE